ncbi:MAG: phenylacetate--CoA ligase family protein [Burkholderiaceae bacterium]|nr:phenylacetate--CoA ligase family protein [Burkholderiaceae bacterium]
METMLNATPTGPAVWQGASRPPWDPLGLWSDAALRLDIWAAAAGDAESLARRQQERLRELLDAARSGSALYRAALAGHDLARVELATLPVFDKPTLMRRFDDWVTDPALRLDLVRAFVADPGRIAEPLLGRYTVWESSGSRGVPGIFVQDERALAVYDTLEATRRAPADALARWIDPGMIAERIAFVGAVDGHFATHVTVQRLRRLLPWITRHWASFSILQPTAALCEALQRFAPTIVATYPTAAAMLAAEQAAARLRIAPREIWTGGETLGPAARRAIEQAFGATLRDSYGASEFLPIAWECTHGALHVNADWVILEPVDAHHRPVPPGTLSHTTLLTNLANHVQPLVRYDLGDRIRMPGTRCDCGSALPVVEVVGRCDDVLRLPGRGGEPVALLPLALSTVLEDDAGIFDFRLEQTGAASLRLTVVVPAGDAGVARRAGEVLRGFAARQGVVGLKLSVQACDALPASVRGRSGKLQRIVARGGAAARKGRATADHRMRSRRAQRAA